jgi:hypothetical protein
VSLVDQFKRWALKRLRDPDMPVPNPPGWVSIYVGDFAALYPQATVGEWAAFAEQHARRAFDDGFQAGWEAKAFGAQPVEPEPVPIARHVLLDEEASRVVSVQAPEGYASVTFVDERGIRHE